MDVGGWLRSLGLGQYEALFRASEIDADILRELTDVDLKELGVPLGHRKRLLRAIVGLAVAETSAAPAASTGAKPHDVAERRQLTVMFCDLVGSTSASVSPLGLSWSAIWSARARRRSRRRSARPPTSPHSCRLSRNPGRSSSRAPPAA